MVTPRFALLALLVAACGGTSGSGSVPPPDVPIVADVVAPDTGDSSAPLPDVALPDAGPAPDDAAPDDVAADAGETEDAPPPADLDGFVAQQMEAGHLPGVATIVIKDGKVALAKGYGFADLEEKRPVTPDTPFMLASVSKTVVAVAAMQAVDAGKLDLDADVSTLLPFPVRNPAAKDTPITTRMLLTHTSSISDDYAVLDTLYVDGDSTIPLGDFLKDYLTEGGAYYDAATCFSAVAPGAAYEYSNVGAALAAYIVEVVVAMPFDAWCQVHIFDPLKMAHTSWHLAGLDAATVALPYAWTEEGGYDTYGLYGYPDYPDGGLRASVNDLARFLSMVIGSGYYDGADVLPKYAVDELLTEQLPDLTGAEGQGLAWYSYQDEGGTYFGHEGGDAGVWTTMFFRQEDGVGVIVLANGDAPEDEAAPMALYEIEARLYEEADSL